MNGGLEGSAYFSSTIAVPVLDEGQDCERLRRLTVGKVALVEVFPAMVVGEVCSVAATPLKKCRIL